MDRKISYFVLVVVVAITLASWGEGTRVEETELGNDVVHPLGMSGKSTCKPPQQDVVESTQECRIKNL